MLCISPPFTPSPIANIGDIVEYIIVVDGAEGPDGSMQGLLLQYAADPEVYGVRENFHTIATGQENFLIVIDVSVKFLL